MGLGEGAVGRGIAVGVAEGMTVACSLDTAKWTPPNDNGAVDRTMDTEEWTPRHGHWTMDTGEWPPYRGHGEMDKAQ
jgi:hypothetical protein